MDYIFIKECSSRHLRIGVWL